jgi:hypothetical protein
VLTHNEFLWGHQPTLLDEVRLCDSVPDGFLCVRDVLYSGPLGVRQRLPVQREINYQRIELAFGDLLSKGGVPIEVVREVRY